MGTYQAVRSLHFSSQTPTLHLDSYRHSPSRCNTVVTINMYTKAIALAILAVAGVQAQSDYNYEDSDPTPTMASTSYMPAPTGAASTGYMPMPSNGTGPYSTGSMGGSATATNTPIYTGAASAQKAAGGVAGLGLALIGLLYDCQFSLPGDRSASQHVGRVKAQGLLSSAVIVKMGGAQALRQLKELFLRDA